MKNLSSGSLMGGDNAQKTEEKKEEINANEDDDPCMTCEIPCEVHESYSTFLSKKINMTNQLNGTVKPYSKHVFLCTGTTEWQPKIEKEEASFAAVFCKEVKAQSEKIEYKILVTASDEPSSQASEKTSEDSCDIYIFPDAIRYNSVKRSDIPSFVKDQVINGTLSTLIPNFKLDKKAYLFICGHKKRDKRCGVAGPMLAAEFQKVIKQKGLENDVQVFQTSHFGGHKYAGNVIIFPEGIWYGRIIPCNVEKILEKHIINGKILKKFLRGKMEPISSPSSSATTNMQLTW